MIQVPLSLMIRYLATKAAPALMVGVRWGMSLFTEALLREFLVVGLEKLVKKTKNKTDDELLARAKKVWGITE